MEQVVEDIEKKMKKTDAQLDTLALQVENIELEIFTEEGQELEVHNLLKSVSEVKDNYQNLRKDLLEVQGLQKQLSSSLNLQLKMMQSKFNGLKERVIVAKHSQINSKATLLGDNK
ncbi:uncharacterized protein LOC109543764 [Dendroctonus ponderosae]|uniref:Ska2 N-terminal domain-containing protein n=1 Tax=Dendroctonus ponderosae TaxID=77166 RepID=A0AAR5Q7Q7_DENPD|nr:uncharacterized protein LOC109543764 [Dendroctonus ponderosae]KAH1011737.1 hypothetical protein HUJ04_001042 [Dendroctonus ponderosae]KAH1018347.1 hypothetical protein HUJ05_006135 [Dendroctonus ponderosae]